MRILLNESFPVVFKDSFPGFEVRTAVEMNWTGKKNGDLLKLMEENVLR